jgi:hypothetical protein
VDRDARRRLWVWLIAFTLLAIGLYAIAISNAAYEATSPGWLTFHVIVRKSYSVIAFALVGYALARTAQIAGIRFGVLYGALSIGAYSALIELGQRALAGSRESIEQQGFDVACGLAGGALGALLAGARAHAPRP